MPLLADLRAGGRNYARPTPGRLLPFPSMISCRIIHHLPFSYRATSLALVLYYKPLLCLYRASTPQWSLPPPCSADSTFHADSDTTILDIPVTIPQALLHVVALFNHKRNYHNQLSAQLRILRPITLRNILPYLSARAPADSTPALIGLSLQDAYMHSREPRRELWRVDLQLIFVAPKTRVSGQTFIPTKTESVPLAHSRTWALAQFIGVAHKTCALSRIESDWVVDHYGDSKRECTGASAGRSEGVDSERAGKGEKQAAPARKWGDVPRRGVVHGQTRRLTHGRTPAQVAWGADGPMGLGRAGGKGDTTRCGVREKRRGEKTHPRTPSSSSACSAVACACAVTSWALAPANCACAARRSASTAAEAEVLDDATVDSRRVVSRSASWLRAESRGREAFVEVRDDVRRGDGGRWGSNGPRRDTLLECRGGRDVRGETASDANRRLADGGDGRRAGLARGRVSGLGMTAEFRAPVLVDVETVVLALGLAGDSGGAAAGALLVRLLLDVVLVGDDFALQRRREALWKVSAVRLTASKQLDQLLSDSRTNCFSTLSPTACPHLKTHAVGKHLCGRSEKKLYGIEEIATGGRFGRGLRRLGVSDAVRVLPAVARDPARTAPEPQQDVHERKGGLSSVSVTRKRVGKGEKEERRSANAKICVFAARAAARAPPGECRVEAAVRGRAPSRRRHTPGSQCKTLEREAINGEKREGGGEVVEEAEGEEEGGGRGGDRQREGLCTGNIREGPGTGGRDQETSTVWKDGLCEVRMKQCASS
ncbi:hypothetical protein FB451DRAFT_1173666 [Mycena latifolia]|nr:hypothetical protein FB451DRAFT_1173666 [Mycena latifolia]